MEKKQEIIQRIENLSDEQFELLLNLWTQQEREFSLIVQADPPTSPKRAV